MSRIRDFYLQRLASTMTKRERADLSGSAIVFAPHPDDETLGCGGTIIRKIAVGASVRVVFMTAGSRSHTRFISPVDLKVIRRQEAVEATQKLGVSDVTFLAFEDGQIDHSLQSIAKCIKEILLEHKPDEIYVTHFKEPHADHRALYEGAIAAVEALSEPPKVYAYPVWYWRQWPWTRLKGGSKRETVRIVQESLSNKLGVGAFDEFQHSVDVRDVLEQKRMALACHATQMKRFENDPNWPILEDVANGDFLDCFFQPYEVFREVTLWK